MGGKSEKSTIFDSQTLPLETGGNHPPFSLTKNNNEMVEKMQNIIFCTKKNTLKMGKSHQFSQKTRNKIHHPDMMVQVLRFDSNPGLLTGTKTWQGGLAWFQDRLSTKLSTKNNGKILFIPRHSCYIVFDVFLR